MLYLHTCYVRLTEPRFSIGMALTDTLDDLISERRIEPQLAMKILANFDRSITEVLADKVKARLTFKVLHTRSEGGAKWDDGLMRYSNKGPPRYIPVLRRGLDVLDQRCYVQDGQLKPDGAGG